MWSIRIRKFSGVIRSSRREGGQVALEYLLVLIVSVSLFMIVAKPYLTDITKKFETLSKKGVFADDPSGSNFYYFPIPK